MGRRGKRAGSSDRALTTPATVILDGLGVEYAMHAFEHDDRERSFGEEAAQALGVSRDVIFKTLLVHVDARTFALAVLPVGTQADLKRIAAALGGKRAEMAASADIARCTGYVAGGVSALGCRTALPCVLDETALGHPSVYVSGGRRGVDISLAPTDLVRATGARVVPISRTRTVT